jgi:hypothetical protein
MLSAFRPIATAKAETAASPRLAKLRHRPDYSITGASEQNPVMNSRVLPPPSLDHFVSQREQPIRHVEPQFPRCFDV